jgi:hypothetical protein
MKIFKQKQTNKQTNFMLNIVHLLFNWQYTDTSLFQLIALTYIYTKVTQTFLNDPYLCTEQSHKISKPTNAYKCMKVYYTHHILPTCFSHSCGHLQGGVLQ